MLAVPRGPPGVCCNAREPVGGCLMCMGLACTSLTCRLRLQLLYIHHTSLHGALSKASCMTHLFVLEPNI